MKKISFISIVLLGLSCLSARAQDSRTGHETMKADVNFTELANYEKAHPKPFVRKHFHEEDEPRHTEREAVDLSKIFLYQPATESDERHRLGILPASPAPTDTFLSTVSDGTSIPPDTHGAVDSHYCVTAINTVVRIQTRTGTVVSTVSEDGFWASVLPHGPGSFDPRIHYDPGSNRWIIACLAYGETAQSQLMIGMSATGNPTGTWHLYSVVIDATGVNWLDYDNIGFNKNWVVLCGNLFNIASGSSPGAQVYVFDKANLMAGTGAPYTMFNENRAFCIDPALTFDTAESSLYMLENYNGSRGQLQLWEVTGTPATPVVTALGNPTSPVDWCFTSFANSVNSGADFAPQLGTTNLIQTNDDRINNCVERNGKLWCSHNVFLPYSSTTNPSRCSAMWWEIDTSGTVNQNGLIDDPTNNNFYAFPNISVNATGDALIGMSWFSPTTYPNAIYRLHMAADPADSMRPPYCFRHGQANYFQNFGGTQNRWGDYSGTCVDPINNSDFWTIQECVPATPANYWDTWWANVQVCPIPTLPTLNIAPVTACLGVSNLYSATAPAATSYTWNITGSGWTGASTTDSINILTGTGIVTVSVSGTSACGTGPVLTFTVVSATVPPTPVLGVAVPPCVGASLAVYTASATFATTYNWTISGSGWTGTSTTANLAVTIGTGPAAISVNAQNACGVSSMVDMVVTPQTVPGVSTSMDVPTTLCSGSTIVVTTPAVAYSDSMMWSVTGTGWSGAGSTNNYTVTVGTGPATIMVYGVNGCGNATPFTYTTGAPVAMPPVSYSVLYHVINMALYDTFTYTGGLKTGATYVWNFGSASLPDSTEGIGPERTLWTVPGLKYITFTVRDSGCASTYTDTVLVRNNVGISIVNAEHADYSIVPNPSNGIFDLEFSQPVTQQFDLKIVDISGRVLYTNRIDGNNGKIFHVATEKLSPGNYYVNIFIDETVYTSKITIQN